MKLRTRRLIELTGWISVGITYIGIAIQSIWVTVIPMPIAFSMLIILYVKT